MTTLYFFSTPMKKLLFRTGIGALAVLLAVPAAIQVAGAQSSEQKSTKSMRSVPTQSCLQAMLAVEDVRLSEFDAMTAKMKQHMQKQREALASAAALSDENARKEAMQKMRQDMKSSMKSAKDQQSSAMQSAMEAAKTACGNAGMLMMRTPGMMEGGMMMKRGKHMNEKKWGNTGDWGTNSSSANSPSN